VKKGGRKFKEVKEYFIIQKDLLIGDKTEREVITPKVKELGYEKFIQKGGSPHRKTFFSLKDICAAHGIKLNDPVAARNIVDTMSKEFLKGTGSVSKRFFINMVLGF